MKKEICIFSLCVCLFGVVEAGPINIKNGTGVAEKVAERVVKSDPDYLSDEAYELELGQASNATKLQALLLKKLKSDKAKERVKKEREEKVKGKK